MQEYFGLCLDYMGTEYTAWHAACLVSQLRAGARIPSKVDASATYSETNYQLHAIICALCRQSIPLPWEQERKADYEAVEIDEFAAWYRDKMKGGDNG